jgi:Uma2 family endonuclease
MAAIALPQKCGTLKALHQRQNQCHERDRNRPSCLFHCKWLSCLGSLRPTTSRNGAHARKERMNTQTAQHTKLTVQDYLRGEEHSEIRHEFIDGQVFAMGGASRRHGLLSVSLSLLLGPKAREKKCQLFIADMKVRLAISGKDIFYYPDLVLSCDVTDRASHFSQTPCLIIEVLSDTTERIDRREKMLAYQTLPSLEEYILVAQDYAQIEIYRRRADWHPEIHTEGTFTLECLDLTTTVAEVYQDLTL